MIKETFDPHASDDDNESITLEKGEETESAAAVGEEPAEEALEEGLCPRCKKRKVAKKHDYCYRCEDELRRTKIPLTGIICAVLAIAVSIICVVIVALDLAPAISVVKGDMYAIQNNWFAAHSAYAEVQTSATEVQNALATNKVGLFLGSLTNPGYGVKSKIYNTVMHIYDPLRAYQNSAYAFGESPDERYLKTDKNYQLCEKYYNRFQDTYLAVQEPVDLMQGMEKPDKSEGEKLFKLLEESRGAEKVDDVFLDYFIYTAATYFDLGEEKIFECFDQMKKDAEASEDDYTWLYYKDYADELLRYGHGEEAATYYQKLADRDISAYDPVRGLMNAKLLAGDVDGADKLVDAFCRENLINGENSDSNYSLLINMARVKGDFEEALDLIEEAQSKYASVPEYYRQKCLIYLAQENYDQAFEAAALCEQNAYYIASYYGDATYYTSDILMSTVYIATSLCDKYGKKDTENAQYISEILEDYKTLNIRQEFRDIVSGKTKVTDYLREGVCDFI